MSSIKRAENNRLSLGGGTCGDTAIQRNRRFGMPAEKPELVRQMADQGMEPWPATHQEFAARLESDYARHAKIFKIIGTPAT